jgi:serine/threonine protein kinase
MGEVYRARDTRLGRDVAVKVLPAQVAGDTEFRERFEFEARAVARLRHPNILALHDIGEVDGLRFIVTELVEGNRSGGRFHFGSFLILRRRSPLAWPLRTKPVSYTVT